MNPFQNTRRDFLSGIAMGSGVLLAGCHRSGETGGAAAPGGPADVTLRIGPALVDIAKDHTVSTIGYNGQVPGPVIRLREGAAVTVDLFNDTDSPELVHWHGLIVPADVDGAEEEKSLAVPRFQPLDYQRQKLRPQGRASKALPRQAVPPGFR
jgi:FtsP/CotA-like multicopper oxidase with cupredoxin domain